MFCPGLEARRGERESTSCVDDVGDKILKGDGAWYVVVLYAKSWGCGRIYLGTLEDSDMG